MPAKQCIIMFVKLPEKGKVKTRLIKAVGADAVLSLYECFVFDFIETLEKNDSPFRICFSPPESLREVSVWLGEHHTYMQQAGRDLGERMKNAFTDAFTGGFSKVIIIGSDLPDLQKYILDTAFSALHVNDIVIGPSVDGGYYLIGFRHDSFLPAVFEGIAWGTDAVLKETLKILREKNYRAHILPELRDVDTIEDLKALYERSKDTEFANSRTMKFISNGLKK
jgi:uncharacterized protein